MNVNFKLTNRLNNFTPRKIDKFLSTDADTADDTALYDFSFLSELKIEIRLKAIRPTLYMKYILGKKKEKEKRGDAAQC